MIHCANFYSLIYHITVALRCPQPPQAPPNPPSSSPPPRQDAAPPAGQGQAADATARPLEVHAPPSQAGAPQGAAVGWRQPAVTLPGSGSLEPWEVETAYYTGWVGAVAIIGAVLMGTGYILIQAMKVYSSL
ncbi:hypothetical protein FOC1_g10008219 [Fusarium oxysporum f. sp. cubense race 1]|uniref:Uncharacterized protein n=1 Tax=Fusarium oxysporum f. sp. cubense (strain race 1) TaxID=1229664 RepID=N4U462_FUSC1|nr:hypothetical protein FOC1_g10008219 [Fusarium oxysporum f. sp. cubense race 1]